MGAHGDQPGAPHGSHSGRIAMPLKPTVADPRLDGVTLLIIASLCVRHLAQMTPRGPCSLMRNDRTWVYTIAIIDKETTSFRGHSLTNTNL